MDGDDARKADHDVIAVGLPPLPPAAQMEMSARPAARSASCLAAVMTMRAPVAANGWPSATLEPFGLSFARSIEPSGASRPRRLRQYSADSQALRVQSTCAANASWIS